MFKRRRKKKDKKISKMVGLRTILPPNKVISDKKKQTDKSICREKVKYE